MTQFCQIKRHGLNFMALVILILAGTPCFGLELDAAKSQGLVGERLDGLLGTIQVNPDQEVQQLVSSINQKRMEEYSKIAQNTGTQLKAVRALAGEKAIQKSPEGHYIQTPQGTWKKK